MADRPGSWGPDTDGFENDELLEFGAARVRWFDRLITPAAGARWRRHIGIAVGLTLIAVAVAIPIQLARHGRTHDAPRRQGNHDVAQVSMASVRALAAEGGPLGDYVRQSSQAGGCALVSVGSSPERAISAAVHKALPEYAIKDAGLTLDQFTGLCAIEVRATYRRADLVVSVTSPNAHVVRSGYTRVETGIETDGELTTKYALAVNESGWTILLGASGPTQQLPLAEDLVQLAQDPSLTW